jgi:hypothetical protein
MPRIRRQNLPRRLWEHLADRVEERQISVEQLVLFSNWLRNEPEVPLGLWFKRFPGMTVCGEGELVKTFLTSSQTAIGEELR